MIMAYLSTYSIAKAGEIVLCCPIVSKQLDHKSKLM